MNIFIRIFGIFALFFGLFGGIAYTAKLFNILWLNELTKDQVFCMFGLTWIWLSRRNISTKIKKELRWTDLEKKIIEGQSKAFETMQRKLREKDYQENGKDTGPAI